MSTNQSIVPYSPGVVITDPNVLQSVGDPTFNFGPATGQWDHAQITIAFVSGGDFNGPITGANLATVQQAIAIWNNTLAGLHSPDTLVQTTDASHADITIGWGTNPIGQLQQTVTQVYQQPAGSPLPPRNSAFASGTQIRLQDPSQQPIDPTTGTYQGNTGTLLQAAEQGIGYALGESASTDPLSVMNPSLTAQNLYNGRWITDQSDAAGLVPPGLVPITSTTVLPPVTNYSGNEDAVYRFFDTTNGTQFVTADATERNNIINTRPDLTYEGVGMGSVKNAAADPNAVPLYRFFDTVHGTHFFTTSAQEAASVNATRPDMTQEGSTIYEHDTQQSGDTAVYRFFDSNNGTHFYTSSATENASIIQTRPDMVSEGIAFYAPKT